MKDLSKYGVTIKEVQTGIYHIKGLLHYNAIIYNSIEDVFIPSDKSLERYKYKIKTLYDVDGIVPNPERYEKFMAVIEYLESVK